MNRADNKWFWKTDFAPEGKLLGLEVKLDPLLNDDDVG